MSAGHVLEVQPGADAGFERGLGDRQVVVGDRAAVFAELVEDVVVGARREDAALLEAHLLHVVEVAHVRTNPARDLGERGAHVDAGLAGFAVLLAVEEELGLADDALRAAEADEELVESLRLLDRVGRARLLPVAERGVRDADVAGEHVRGVESHDLAVDLLEHLAIEEDARRQRVREHVLEKLRFGHFYDVVASWHVRPFQFLREEARPPHPVAVQEYV